MWGHGPVTSVVGRWKLGIRKDLKVTLGSTEVFKKGQSELCKTLSKDDLEFLISPASIWRLCLMRLHIFTRHSVYALLGTEPRTSCSASMLTECIFSSALLAFILSLQARRLVLHGKGPCGDWRIDTTSPPLGSIPTPALGVQEDAACRNRGASLTPRVNSRVCPPLQGAQAVW